MRRRLLVRVATSQALGAESMLPLALANKAEKKVLYTKTLKTTRLKGGCTKVRI